MVPVGTETVMDVGWISQNAVRRRNARR